MKVAIFLGLITVGFQYSNAVSVGLIGSLAGGLNIGLGSRHSSLSTAYGGHKYTGIAAGLGAGIGTSSYGDSGNQFTVDSSDDKKIVSTKAGLDVGLDVGLKGGIAGQKKGMVDVDLNANGENGYNKVSHGSSAGQHVREGSSPATTSHRVGANVGIGNGGGYEREQITGYSGDSSVGVNTGVGLNVNIKNTAKTTGGSAEGSSSGEGIHRSRHYHGHKHGHIHGRHKHRGEESYKSLSASSESGSFGYGQSASGSSLSATHNTGNGKQGTFHSNRGPYIGSHIDSHTSSHTSSYGGSTSWSSQSSHTNSGFSASTSQNSQHETGYSTIGGSSVNGQSAVTSGISISSGSGIDSEHKNVLGLSQTSQSSSGINHGSLLGLGAGLNVGVGQTLHSKGSSSAGSTNVHHLSQTAGLVNNKGASSAGVGIGLGAGIAVTPSILSSIGTAGDIRVTNGAFGSSSKEVLHSSKENSASIGLGVNTAHSIGGSSGTFGNSGYSSSTFNGNKHVSGHGASSLHGQSSGEIGIKGSATTGLVGQIGGLVEGLHSVTSSNSVAGSAESTGLLGGLLGVHSSAGGYKNNAGSLESAGGYSSGHKVNYAGASSSSGASSGGLSLGLGLGLGR